MTRAGREGRRPGIFEGLPRAAHRWAADRYVDLCVAGVLGHGIAVAAFGVMIVSLYVDLTWHEALLYGGATAAGYLVEGAVAAVHLRRQLSSLTWERAARLPAVLIRKPDLYLLGLVAAVLTDLLLAHLLDLSATESLRLLALAYPLYLSSVTLRYVGLELGMRPVLDALDQDVPDLAEGSSLHRRLVAAIPTVTWGSGVIVAGILTDDSRRLGTIGGASLVAIGVAAGVSIWLSLVLADAVTGPVIDLRDATRRVASGDLTVRAPVVSTDETGQLAASFNAMVAGLDERERLREAIGVFVDPTVAERVLEEGPELQGQEREVSVLFLDVRDFTAFAETTPAPEVVAALNRLYDLVVPVVVRYGGHANRFLGDGLLAVFGAPEPCPDHAAAAVGAACEISALLHEQRSSLRVGMGIDSGSVVVGTIGGGGRRDFTVIGDHVNTAARAEAATRVTGDDLLITEATLRALEDEQRTRFAERPGVPLKGKATTIRLFALVGA